MPERRRRQSDRWFQFLMVAITLAAIFTYVEVFVLNEEASIHYVSLEETDPGPYCPGDMLTYWSQLTSDHPPTVVEITRSLWSENNRILYTTELNYRFAITQPGNLLGDTNNFTLPNLPPGNYRLDIIAQGSRLRQSSLAIPFTIGDDCG